MLLKTDIKLEDFIKTYSKTNNINFKEMKSNIDDLIEVGLIVVDKEGFVHIPALDTDYLMKAEEKAKSMSERKEQEKLK